MARLIGASLRGKCWNLVSWYGEKLNEYQLQETQDSTNGNLLQEVEGRLNMFGNDEVYLTWQNTVASWYLIQYWNWTVTCCPYIWYTHEWNPLDWSLQTNYLDARILEINLLLIGIIWIW